MSRVDWGKGVVTEIPSCPYVNGSGVACPLSDRDRCDKCGWRKEVSLSRLAKIAPEYIEKLNRKPEKPICDQYAVSRQPDGSYIVTKNGEYYIDCGHSKDNAEYVVEILSSESAGQI